MPLQYLSDVSTLLPRPKQVRFEGEDYSYEESYTLHDIKGVWRIKEDFGVAKLGGIYAGLLNLELEHFFVNTLVPYRLYKKDDKSYVLLQQKDNEQLKPIEIEKEATLSWQEIFNWLESSHLALNNTRQIAVDSRKGSDMDDLTMEDLYADDRLEIDYRKNLSYELYDLYSPPSDILVDEHLYENYINEYLTHLFILPEVVVRQYLPNFSFDVLLKTLVFNQHISFIEYVLSQDEKVILKKFKLKLNKLPFLSDQIDEVAGFNEEETFFQIIPKKLKWLQYVCGLANSYGTLKKSSLVSYHENIYNSITSFWIQLVKHPIGSNAFKDLAVKLSNYHHSVKSIEQSLRKFNKILKKIPTKTSIYNSKLQAIFETNQYIPLLYRCTFMDNLMSTSYLHSGLLLTKEQRNLEQMIDSLQKLAEIDYDTLTLVSRIQTKLSCLDPRIPNITKHFINVWLPRVIEKTLLEEKRVANNYLRFFVSCINDDSKQEELERLEYTLAGVGSDFSINKKFNGVVQKLLEDVYDGKDADVYIKDFEREYAIRLVKFEYEQKRDSIWQDISDLLSQFQNTTIGDSILLINDFFKAIIKLEKVYLSALGDSKNLLKTYLIDLKNSSNPSDMIGKKILLEIAMIFLEDQKREHFKSYSPTSVSLPIMLDKTTTFFSTPENIQKIGQLIDLAEFFFTVHVKQQQLLFGKEDHKLIKNITCAFAKEASDPQNKDVLFEEVSTRISEIRCLFKLKKSIEKFKAYELSRSDEKFIHYLNVAHKLLQAYPVNIRDVSHCEMVLSDLNRSLAASNYQNVLAFKSQLREQGKCKLLYQFIMQVQTVKLSNRSNIVIPSDYKVGSVIEVCSASSLGPNNIVFADRDQVEPKKPTSPKKLNDFYIQQLKISRNGAGSPTIFGKKYKPNNWENKVSPRTNNYG